MQTMLPVSTAHDMANDAPLVQRPIDGSRKTEKNLCVASSSSALSTRAANDVATSLTANPISLTVKPRNATRSISDILDDVLYTYTGVSSWAVFSQLQREGAGLRQQLQNGAAFEHAAVHPVISRYLTEWTKKLRMLQAGRVSTLSTSGATSGFALAPKKSPTEKKSSSVKKQLRGSGKSPNSPFLVTGSASAGAFIDTSSLAEKELDITEMGNASAAEEEEGLLPLWDDIEPTQRCGPAVLHAIRGAVQAYFKALLYLVTLAEQFVGRWGHLSPSELRDLQAAMAREKAAHVPASFLFSAFTELNASEERLDNAVGDLTKCDRMTVLRLNRNPALTELCTLPPSCRVLMACGCQLTSFLTPPTPTMPSKPLIYASLTTLGLAYNQLKDTKFLSLLPSLVVLDASFNYIVDLQGVVRDVAAHDALAEVTFQGNPFTLLDTYRTIMVQGCMRLEKLDKIAITSEELALAFQKSQLRDREVAGEAGEQLSTAEQGAAVVSAAVAAIRKAGKRKSASGKLTLPVVTGTGGADGELKDTATRDTDQTLKPRRNSQRKLSGTSAALQTASSPAPTCDCAPCFSFTDEALRTTVAAKVELLVLRGLSTFESVVQTHTVEELLPTSPFVYELAGMDSTHGALSSLPGGTQAVAGTTPATPLTSPPGAPLPSGSRKGKGNPPSAFGADSGGGGGNGRLGTSPAVRSTTGGGAASSKRAVAAPPLYELSSRVCIEGCWGGDNEDDQGVAQTRRDEPFLKKSTSANAGVRVDFEVALGSTAPTSPQRGGARHGAATRLPSDTAVKQRKKHASSAGGSPTPAAGSASAGNGAGGGFSALLDPYVLSGASADGALGRRNSLSSTGVYTAQLPLTHRLVASLQQPLVLHVIVEDTYRFIDGPALRGPADIGARAHSVIRGGSSGGLRASRDGPAQPLSLQTPAGSISASPLPAAALMSLLAPGPKTRRENADAVDDSVTECHRREVGVIRLNPFDLFGNEGTGALRVAQPSSGLTAGPSSTFGATAFPLPPSRVLFLHGAELDVNTHAVHTMQHELQQQQRQLQETLQAYNAMLEQCVQAAGENRIGAADAAVEPAFSPSTGGDAQGSSAPGLSPPRPGKRGVPPPAATPFLPPVAALTATPPPKPSSRSGQTSASVPPNSHVTPLQLSLKEQQVSVVRQAVRALALQARLTELEAVTLSADARMSIGRGPSPPLATAADAELDALRYRREVPATRKGRPQPPKSGRR